MQVLFFIFMLFFIFPFHLLYSCYLCSHGLRNVSIWSVKNLCDFCNDENESTETRKKEYLLAWCTLLWRWWYINRLIYFWLLEDCCGSVGGGGLWCLSVRNESTQQNHTDESIPDHLHVWYELLDIKPFFSMHLGTYTQSIDTWYPKAPSPIWTPANALYKSGKTTSTCGLDPTCKNHNSCFYCCFFAVFNQLGYNLDMTEIGFGAHGAGSVSKA